MKELIKTPAGTLSEKSESCWTVSINFDVAAAALEFLSERSDDHCDDSYTIKVRPAASALLEDLSGEEGDVLFARAENGWTRYNYDWIPTDLVPGAFEETPEGRKLTFYEPAATAVYSCDIMYTEIRLFESQGYYALWALDPEGNGGCEYNVFGLWTKREARKEFTAAKTIARETWRDHDKGYY